MVKVVILRYIFISIKKISQKKKKNTKGEGRREQQACDGWCSEDGEGFLVPFGKYPEYFTICPKILSPVNFLSSHTELKISDKLWGVKFILSDNVTFQNPIIAGMEKRRKRRWSWKPRTENTSKGISRVLKVKHLHED